VPGHTVTFDARTEPATLTPAAVKVLHLLSIQNFLIINTDWSLRSKIVDNCIHACYVRAAAYEDAP
jgi:hypothetical protein